MEKRDRDSDRKGWFYGAYEFIKSIYFDVLISVIYLEIFHPRWSWVSPVGIKSNQILLLTASFDPFRRNNNIVNSIWILLGIKGDGRWNSSSDQIRHPRIQSIDQPLFYKKGRIITVLLDNQCSSKFCLFYKSNGTRSRRNIKYKNCHRNFRWELLRIRSSGRGHNIKQNLQVTDGRRTDRHSAQRNRLPF